MGLEIFRGLVYGWFSKSVDNEENRELFRFLCELTERRERFCELLVNSFFHQKDPDSDPNFWLAGGYFAATGDGKYQQGFVQDLLAKLDELQSEITDSSSRLRQIARRRFWANVLNTIAFIVLFANFALAYFVYDYLTKKS
jgi:hypothetical protein